MAIFLFTWLMSFTQQALAIVPGVYMGTTVSQTKCKLEITAQGFEGNIKSPLTEYFTAILGNQSFQLQRERFMEPQLAMFSLNSLKWVGAYGVPDGGRALVLYLSDDQQEINEYQLISHQFRDNFRTYYKCEGLKLQQKPLQ